MRVYIHLT